jgi:hypothetical protein
VAECDGFGDQVFGPPPRYENSFVEQDPQSAELREADHVLDRQPGDALLDHAGELGVVVCCGDQQVRFVLGEDAAGGAEGADDGGGCDAGQITGRR